MAEKLEVSIGSQKPVDVARGVDGEPPPTLSRAKRDQVRWFATKAGVHKVIFRDSSPFERHTFTIPDGEPEPSGPVTGKNGVYKYTIMYPDGTTLDPKVYVED